MRRPSKGQSLVSLLALVLPILFFGCDNDSEDSSYDIYAFGVQNQKGTFWRNGVEHPEPLISNLMLGSFVDGKDFYVAGIGQEGTFGSAVAKYWKNGKEVSLSNGTKDEWAYDVAVLGQDVYAVGYENAGLSGAKYWKNGSEVFLGPRLSNNFSMATDIQIAGSDFYILGVENVNNNDSIVTRLWKNGESVRLEHLSEYYVAEAMLIDGSDVYLMGRQKTTEGYITGAFWKNGSLISSPPVSGLYPMLIKGGDRYAIGTFNSAIGYTKNDKFTELQAADMSTNIVSIDVFGSDVIVAGNLIKNSKFCGIVWKNGVPVAPFLGDDPTIKLQGAVAVKK